MTAVQSLDTVALHVPQLAGDVDTLTAALAYARAGWYVLPIRLRGDHKHAGSVVGRGWPAKSSRDPEVLVAWFAATDHGVALHCGRSGAVSFDVDHPEAVPEPLAGHLGLAPFQSSRADQPGRGHHVFAQPPGMLLGNGRGKLAGPWGEVRGRNGIIVAAPTPHGAGGCYRWQRTGPVPALPPELAALLPSGSADAADVATDAEVAAFLDQHTRTDRPWLLAAVAATLRRKIGAGESRHESAVFVTPGALREAAAGLYPARQAVAQLGAIFTEALVTNGRNGRPVAAREAAEEWAGIVAWAVGQAATADPATVRAAVDLRAPDPDPDAGNLPQLLGTADPAQEPPPGPPEPPGRPAVLDCLIDWRAAYSGEERPVDWLVVGLLERGRLVAVYSAAKAGKSLLLLDICASLATGRSVLGEPATGEVVPVLYCDYENTPGDVVDRLRDLGYTDPDELDQLHYLSLPSLPPLDTDAGGRALLDAAQAVGAELVVVDTASRTITGPENDADTWLGWYRCTGLRLKRAGIALVRLDHSGKDAKKGQRGSSGKTADVDLVLRLVADHDRLDLIREEKRQNYYAERTLLRRREVGGVLVHERTTSLTDVDEATTALMDFLDAEGIPLDAGRPAISAHLNTRGYRATKRTVEAAIRLRKVRPTPAGSARAASGQRPPRTTAPPRTGTPRAAPESPTGSAAGSGGQPLHGAPADDCPPAPLYKSGQRAGGHPGQGGPAIGLLADMLGAEAIQ